MSRIRACSLFLLATCCAGRSPRQLTCDAVPSASAPEEALNLADRFERDANLRNKCLRWSLVNPDNGYSKTRFVHYDKDWAQLPVARFKTRPIVPADLGKPVPTPDASWSSVPSGTFAASVDGLRKRGEQMFTRFPAQVERSLIPILRQESGPARYGFWQTAASVGGMVWVALPGGVFPALTCSSCHASIDTKGSLRLGLSNHSLDLGKAKDDYAHVRSLFSTWGPGRMDIAADDRDNPIVIPDLRAVRFEQYLHRTANIRNSLIALALRVETGLIVAHFNAVRPDRRDAFALAYYLWSLGGDFDLAATLRHPGRKAFERHCASCHRGEAHSGGPVTPESIGSPVAKMPSAARGTGRLQVTSLLGVSERRLLLFGGEAKGIDSLLDPNRNAGGHYMGRELDATERAAIRAYLEAL